MEIITIPETVEEEEDATTTTTLQESPSIARPIMATVLTPVPNATIPNLATRMKPLSTT